jgi:hypothetical protein
LSVVVVIVFFCLGDESTLLRYTSANISPPVVLSSSTKEREEREREEREGRREREKQKSRPHHLLVGRIDIDVGHLRVAAMSFDSIIEFLDKYPRRRRRRRKKNSEIEMELEQKALSSFENTLPGSSSECARHRQPRNRQ